MQKVGNVEGRGSGASGVTKRGRGGVRKKMGRPKSVPTSIISYCEPDSDSDKYANESADSDCHPTPL